MTREQRIKCYHCGHAWIVDLDCLDERDLLIYKGGQSEKAQYRVPCPQCHTVNTFEEARRE